MALPRWPEALPSPRAGLSYAPADGTLIRTQLEDGPARVRRRFSVELFQYQLSASFNRAQMEIFEAWGHHYLDDFSGWFQMLLPAGAGIYLAECRLTAPWTSRLGPDDVFEVSIEIEVRNRPTMALAELDLLLGNSNA